MTNFVWRHKSLKESRKETTWPWNMRFIHFLIKETKLKGALSGLRQFLAIASQLKMTRSAFYFTLKALFVLEIFQILFWVFGYVGIQHDERAKVNFKIYYVSNWIKTITIHMLPDISRTQGNLTTKFVPLIEYDIRNFLVEKSCTKCGGQSFFKRWKLNIFLDQQVEILYSLFCCMSKSRTTKTYWNWVTNHLFFIHIKLFSKTERGLKLVSMSHFQHDIWRKISLQLCSSTSPNFIFWLLLLLEISSNMLIVKVYVPFYVVNFEIYLSFLIKPFSYVTTKVSPKM